MKKLFFLMIIFSLISGVYSATITGDVVEWNTFETLDNVVVTINTEPVQRDVTSRGEYSFEVGEGEFVISAEYFEDGEVVYTDSQEIVVREDGRFVVDLIMFPPIEDISIEEELETIDFNDIGEVAVGSEITDEDDYSSVVGLGIVVFALIFGILVVYVLVKSSLLQSVPGKEEKGELDEYAEEVLALLRRRGNRLTQKEIRDEIQGIGEAKISLIISELEEMGKVKKIKKGRGNIIVLKK